MGDPLAIFPALCRPDKEGVYQASVHTTGLAMGIGFAWTVTGCPWHAGQTYQFQEVCKTLPDGIPLKLKRLDGDRPSVQAVLDEMGRDLTEGPPKNEGEEWHFAPRPCIGCNESGVDNKVGQKLVLETDGPSHFFAFVGGSGNNVEPSLEVNAFGSAYKLLAIVYHLTFHFVSQVYYPSRECWLMCDSLSDKGQATCTHKFDDKSYRGQEYIFLYVKNSVVGNTGPRTATLHEKGGASSSSTGNLESRGDSANTRKVSLGKLRDDTGYTRLPPESSPYPNPLGKSYSHIPRPFRDRTEEAPATSNLPRI